MAERKLRIRNYRNIGIKEPQELLLNTSFAKGEMGSLVIVVGPNNCGKSNCLDALISFGNKDGISQNDIPDFDNGNPIPELSLVLCDGETTLGINKSLEDNKKEKIGYFYSHKDVKVQSVQKPIPSKEATNFALQATRFLVQQGHYGQLPSDMQKASRDVANKGVYNGDYALIKEVHNKCKSLWGGRYYDHFGLSNMNDSIAEGYIEEFNINVGLVPGEVQDWEQKHSIDVNPSILRFEQTVTSHSQLGVAPEQVKSSPFFAVLFSAIQYDIEELVNCYNKVREQGLNGLLKRTQKEINHKLEEVTSQFNKLFFLSDKKYHFEITLESNKVYLSIFIDELPLHLDKQSSGFRWFFNFYFSVISQTTLKRGDIIVMDEPATNLHMRGIQELRTFIKDFAQKNELTIVISTHIPFFVDVNYLEEVRVVNRDGDGSVIENKFHAIGDHETDSLKPIKEALTVGRYVMYDQSNVHTIFVEGITDYCYLTAFKLINKIDNVVFLPIQGVLKSDVVETLQKIQKFVTILVDGDHAGKTFQEKYKDKKNIEILSLSDFNQEWTTIESLFSNQDKPKTKFFNDCVAFKNRMTSNKLSKETKDNFKKLLDNIAM